MRVTVPLSAGWRFHDSAAEEAWLAPGFSPGGDPAWRRVDIPHTLQELPLNHFDEKSYQKKGTYWRSIDARSLPRLAEGSRAFLDFEGVAVSCKVWLNGVKVGGHAGAYTPFSLDVTEALVPGGENSFVVEVDAAEDPGVPPFGNIVDYLVYGGVYRAVFLRVQGAVYIETIHARPSVGAAACGAAAAKDGAAGAGEGAAAAAPAAAAAAAEGLCGLAVDIAFGGRDESWSGAAGAAISARLSKCGAVVAEASSTLGDLSGSREKSARLEFSELRGIERWDIDSPALYDLEVTLSRGGEEIDRAGTRVGFRTARFTADGFFLNGRRVFLRGLNRHQSYPYVGYAMGPGAQRRDAEILKRELGVKIVRTSHYPQSRHFLDACDELGLLVLEELPGWQHIGDAAWKDRALADLGDMIQRDRNRPSIILWGARINESPDDDAFYERTNALAAKLDPDRQRGGIRNFRGSALLEDVYTFNDFTHDGGKPIVAPSKAVKGKAADSPYMITEHSGHMFPTKRWDQEERLAEHARRHARILDAAMGDPGTAGAIGWCAFDYNTHKDFGSGDRICYHGVSDMFRIPKPAAALYASQEDPRRRVVLEAASIFAKGERGALRELPVEVYTNCDAVEVWRFGEKVGRFYPDRQNYPHLEHPPVVLRDLIGDTIDKEGFAQRDKEAFLALAAKVMTDTERSFNVADKLRFLAFTRRTGLSMKATESLLVKYGYAWGRPGDVLELVGILDGAEAARKSFGCDARADRLELAADDTALRVRPGDEWDAVRVVATMRDQYGNRCAYAFDPLQLEVAGPGRVVGPSLTSLSGGAVAFWIAATSAPGSIIVRASTPRFAATELRLEAALDHDR